jgi:hypothetical protein
VAPARTNLTVEHAMNRAAYAVFHDAGSAQKAVDALVAAHFDADEIRVLARAGARMQPLPIKLRLGFRRSIPTGVVLGGIGCAIAVPILGPAWLEGWHAVLLGVLVGAALGWVLGAIGGLSFWNEQIDFAAAAKGPRCMFLVGVETFSMSRLRAAQRALRDTALGPGMHDPHPVAAR